eukprot:6124173-Prorocentrum_lima.AAC.1
MFAPEHVCVSLADVFHVGSVARAASSAPAPAEQWQRWRSTWTWMCRTGTLQRSSPAAQCRSCMPSLAAPAHWHG